MEGPRGQPGPFPSWWGPPLAPFPKDSTPEKAKSLSELLILRLIHHFAACVFRKPPASHPTPPPVPPGLWSSFPSLLVDCSPRRGRGNRRTPREQGDTESREPPGEMGLGLVPECSRVRASPQGTRVSSSLGWGRGLSRAPIRPSSPHFPVPRRPPTPPSFRPTSPWSSGAPCSLSDAVPWAGGPCDSCRLTVTLAISGPGRRHARQLKPKEPHP